MRRSLACYCWTLVAALLGSASAHAQFYQSRPQAAPAPPSVNHIGVPGQALPRIQVQQFGPAPTPAVPAPKNRVSGRSPVTRPQVVGQPYWFGPWRLRRR
jgi:hypothetical protein